MSAPRAFRSSRSIGLVVLTCLGLDAVLSVLVTGFRLAERGLLWRAARGEVVTVEEATRNDDRIAVVSGIALALILVTGIVWVVWQHHAHANLHAARIPGLWFTPGWVVGWWFVPIASFWKPFQTMRELWKASGGRPDWVQMPTWPLIGWWWAALLTAGVLDQVGAALIRGAHTIEPILAGNLWLILAEVVWLIAALLAIALVRSVIQRQERLETVNVPAIGVPPRPDHPELGG